VKCIRCGRALDIPTVQIRTRAGPAAYGPKCAKLAGLWPRKQERHAPQAKPSTDPRQMALELSA
jgi:hypothetical protein